MVSVLPRALHSSTILCIHSVSRLLCLKINKAITVFQTLTGNFRGKVMPNIVRSRQEKKNLPFPLTIKVNAFFHSLRASLCLKYAYNALYRPLRTVELCLFMQVL